MPGANASKRIFEDEGELYKLLVDSVRDYAIFALDTEGYIATWNPGAERFNGYKASEIIGKHFSIFYPPEDVAAGKPARELIEAGQIGRVEDEGWRIRKDGNRFWSNVVITALRQNGELVGFAKITRDLTDRRAADEALRESEERFRLLVQSVTDYGIVMLDADGHVVSWNEGAEAINQYTADEIIGQHVSTFYVPEDNAVGKAEHELAVAARVGRFEEEGWRVRKDGTHFWANVVVTPLRNRAGQLLGYAKVTRDLTERRAAEQRALADARRVAEVEAASRAKSEFLAAMSHELRTPLNAIGGFTELLMMGIRGPVTPEQMHDLDRIRRSQQHLLGIISDLLNFSKIEAGQLTYDIQPVVVAQVLQDVGVTIRPMTEAKQLAYEAGACGADVVAMADRTKLDQILLNLLSNAVKFTRPGGRVTTECSLADGRVLVRVRDTGIGIPPEMQDAIFEPFVQVGRTLNTPNEGAGLGLAISRDLARAMGGELTVESVVGHGATFTLSLPSARAKENAA
jgi:PAS domain S-box-containing protein